jgi:phage terminase large subunit
MLPQLEDANNHVIDALRYACEGARRAGAGPNASGKQVAYLPQVGGWMG